VPAAWPSPAGIVDYQGQQLRYSQPPESGRWLIGRMNYAQEATFLAAAGALAGTVGTAGGITSLVSYPALLAAGVPALPADVANIVRDWPYRPDDLVMVKGRRGALGEARLPAPAVTP
jgi:hypothetical protein